MPLNIIPIRIFSPVLPVTNDCTGFPRTSCSYSCLDSLVNVLFPVIAPPSPHAAWSVETRLCFVQAFQGCVSQCSMINGKKTNVPGEATVERLCAAPLGLYPSMVTPVRSSDDPDSRASADRGRAGARAGVHPRGGVSSHPPEDGRGTASFGAEPSSGGRRTREGGAAATKEGRGQQAAGRERKGGVLAARATGTAALAGPRTRRSERQVVDDAERPTGG